MLSHSAWPHRLSPSTTILRTSLTHAQSEESGIEPGHIATITGSLASFPDHDPDHYDTDHTDLASESDEAELRRVLLRDVNKFSKQRLFQCSLFFSSSIFLFSILLTFLPTLFLLILNFNSSYSCCFFFSLDLSHFSFLPLLSH
jgi:hypothetical protein